MMHWLRLSDADDFGSKLAIMALCLMVVLVPVALHAPSDGSAVVQQTGIPLRVYTDGETGLQYLSTAQGGLTPRLDSDGKQMREATP